MILNQRHCHSSRGGRFRGDRCVWLLAAGLISTLAGWLPSVILAQGNPPADPADSAETSSAEAVAESFDKRSLALRTALHYDASLGPPLEKLLELYQEADRLEELLALYRTHVAEYPADIGARIVLIRLLETLNRPEAFERLRLAVQAHPEDAMLQYLLFEARDKRADPRAFEPLAVAVSLAKRRERRDAWLDLLLERAESAEERAVAEERLVEAREAAEGDPGALLALARKMLEHGFEALCLKTLARVGEVSGDPETGVEVELLSARAEATSGSAASAGQRLDALLEKVAPDYWRRREILRLRLSLIDKEAERESLRQRAKEAFEANPNRESAVLDYADMLSASELRREAAEVLLEASKRLAESERLEKACLQALERLNDHDMMEGYLAERVRRSPLRTDLRYRLAKTQFLVGRMDEARREFETVIDQTDPGERLERTLELARYLRRMSLPVEALEYFEKVVAQAPRRLDILRELAEGLVAARERGRAARLLRESPYLEAEKEDFTDLVQFMMGSEFLPEARDALEARLANSPDDFELKLALIEVLGKTGEQALAVKHLEDARSLADTGVRYRSWLERAMALHESFGEEARFFDDEQFRLLGEGDPWTSERAERFLALCEVGDSARLDARVLQALRSLLSSEGVPRELELRAKLLLVEALENTPGNELEAERQLQDLAGSDPSRSDEYRLRRALIYHLAQRPDLAQALFEELEIERVAAESVLRESYPMFLDYRRFDLALACVQTLTRLADDDLDNWQRELGLLAAMGREDTLRRSVRRLLAKQGRLNLDEASRERLHGMLLDSYWRSISTSLETQDPGERAEVLSLIESVEREALRPGERAWVQWARAWVLNQGGEVRARDAALEAMAREVRGSDQRDPMIRFPDGLAISLPQATRLLKRPVDVAKDESAVLEPGPLRVDRLAWAFDLGPARRLFQVLPDGDAVLLLDDAGCVYRVDAATGKLIWKEVLFEGHRPRPASATMMRTAPMGTRSGASGVMTQIFSGSPLGAASSRSSPSPRVGGAPGITVTVTGGASSLISSRVSRPVGTPSVAGIGAVPRLVSDGGDRFFLAEGSNVRCFRSEDAQLLWEARLAEEVMPAPWVAVRDHSLARPRTEIALRGEVLICFSPASSVAAAIDASSGKLLWHRRIEGTQGEGAADQPRVFALNAGAAFGKDSLLVFGESSEILDMKTGETLWSLSSPPLMEYPARLQRKGDEGNGGGVASVAKPAPATGSGNAVSGGTGPSSSGPVSGGLSSVTSSTWINHGTPGAGRGGQIADFVQLSGRLVAPAAYWARERTRQNGAAHAIYAEGHLFFLLGDMHRVSVSLPLGAGRFKAGGTWLGISGQMAWFQEGNALQRIDLEDGRRELYSLADIAEQGVASAVLSGNRLYASGSGGFRILHARSGAEISRSDRPEALERFASDSSHRGRHSSGQPLGWLWQGLLQRDAGGTYYCVPPLDQVADGRLYTTLSQGCLVALEAGND